MIKLRGWERRQALVDLSTPRERSWLDRLQQVRGDLGRLRITERYPSGQPKGFRITLRRRLHGCAFGWLPVSMAWVKREVYRLERQQRREDAREVANSIGAHI